MFSFWSQNTEENFSEEENDIQDELLIERRTAG